MTWHLCDGSSEFLVDMWGGCDNDMHWATAKKHFRDKGYFGDWLLIGYTQTGFKAYKINIKPKKGNANDKH